MAGRWNDLPVRPTTLHLARRCGSHTHEGRQTNEQGAAGGNGAPARKGCRGASSAAHSSQARSGSGARKLGGSSTRDEQQAVQKMLPQSRQ